MYHLHTKLKLTYLIAIAAVATFCMNYHTGPANSGQRKTNAPFDGSNCSSCHTGGSTTPTVTMRLLSGSTPVTTYSPGSSYTLEVSITPSGMSYGFQLVCVQASSNTDINNWGTLPSSVRNSLSGGRHYIEQSAVLSSGTITLPWTAPSSSSVGDVMFYASGMIVNNNGGSSGDKCTSDSLRVRSCALPSLSTSVSNVSCFGLSNGSIDLTASGTGTLTYAWSGPAGFTATTQDITALRAGNYSVTVTSSSGCSSTTVATVTQPASIDIIIGSDAPVCNGSAVHFTSFGASGGTSPYTYSWSGPAGFSSTAFTPTLSVADSAHIGTYTVTVTDNNGCTGSSTTNVTLLPTPIVNLGPDVSICPGTSSITIDARNIGSRYLWNTADTTRTITVTAAGTYYVTVTNPSGCRASDTIVISTSTFIVPSLTITPDHDTICAHSPVVFSPYPTNGGTAPTYKWYKNGTFTGITTIVYTDTGLATTDRIYCEMTSSASCAIPRTATSEQDSVFVKPVNYPSLTITRSIDSPCTYAPIMFTAHPVNGGSSPYIAWYVRDTFAGAGTSFSFVPAGTDNVLCKFASSLDCPIPDTVRVRYTFPVLPFVSPYVIITNTPSDTMRYPGQMVTFFASTTYGGTRPTYKWYLNRKVIAGATNTIYTRRVYERDTVFCVMTSNATCASPLVDTSNVITIYKDLTSVNDVAQSMGISIVPNPSTGDFVLSGTINSFKSSTINLTIYDIKGGVVHQTEIPVSNSRFDHTLTLKNILSPGMYQIKLQADLETKIVPLVVK